MSEYGHHIQNYDDIDLIVMVTDIWNAYDNIEDAM